MSINFTTLATSALGFTVALAWNDAVSKTVGSFFPPRNEKAAVRATLIYALVITILVIFVVAVINHTRKLVHKMNSDGSPCPGPEGAAAVQEGMRARGAPAGKRDCQNCADCAHCFPQGLSPVVRLWEPPRGKA